MIRVVSGGVHDFDLIRRRVLTWFLNLTVSVVFVCNYIFCYSTVKVSQQVSKHRHFTMIYYVKGKTLASKEDISVFLTIIHQQQKTRFLHVHLSVWPCSETCMSMFRNRLLININAMKTDKYSGYFQCPATKLFLIMQNDVFNIILRREVSKVYDFIKFLGTNKMRLAKIVSIWIVQYMSMEWAFPAPHVVPVTIYPKQLENQSRVSVGEQTVQHMWHTSVKFVNKVYMTTIEFPKNCLKFPWRISITLKPE